MKMMVVAAASLVCAAPLSAAGVYASLCGGTGTNACTREAPLKLLCAMNGRGAQNMN